MQIRQERSELGAWVLTEGWDGIKWDLRHGALPYDSLAPQDGQPRICRVGEPAGTHTDSRMSAARQKSGTELKAFEKYRRMPARK